MPVGLPTCTSNLCWPDWYLVPVRTARANTLFTETFSLSYAFEGDRHV